MNIPELFALFQSHPVICTDTRKLTKDCLYFALKGENFNGNAFAELALKQGAAFAIIDEREYMIHEHCILVEDVLSSLQQLATYHRKKLNIPLIAIVGSNGKTTSKELISSVLSTHFNILSTPGNFNNHIGLPLTLLMLNPNHQIAVIEMGANHIGENAFLCELAMPSHGLITNNGKDHLEGFGSMEGVEKSNRELYDYLLKNEGTAFVNANDADLILMAKKLVKKVTYAANFGSTSTIADYIGYAQKLQPQIEFSIGDDTGQIISSHLSGDYNFDNIMAAVCIGLHFGLNTYQIKEGIESYKPQNLRSQLIEKEHNRIFLDAYNANPSSMQASIRNFAAMPGENKLLILGDMYELGSYEATEHQAITDYCKKLNLEQVILIGPAFGKTLCDYEKHEHINTLTAQLEKAPFNNQFVFIKGSRGMKLETLLDWL
ncbi:MAG: UDP-N-acetylmuramoyl-tripeptide--D-alanyl-D-alanine ligase [Bacteroidota bacterium]|nr:UDP-N-acetylmuramoyl-tripeptide--D-alanyl-D-alanine ligase [Bacteroidota bacterium]